MENQVKTFWERPEGRAGLVTILILLAALGYGAYLVLPLLLVLLSNVLYAYAMIGAIVLLTFLVTNKQVRLLASYSFKATMQALFAIDPLMVLKGSIQSGYKKLASMEQQTINVRKQIRNLQQVMDQNDTEMRNEVALAGQAKKQGFANELALHTANAGRLAKSNENIKLVWNQLDMAYRVLTTMKGRAETVLKDFENTVSVEERQLRALKSGTSAYRSAMSVIKGDPEEKYQVDQAMEKLADQIGERLGEMDHFMDISATILKSAELQNSADREVGLKMLEEWSQGPSLLLGSDKKVLLSASANDPGKATVAPTGKNWDDLLS